MNHSVAKEKKAILISAFCTKLFFFIMTLMFAGIQESSPKAILIDPTNGGICMQ